MKKICILLVIVMLASLFTVTGASAAEVLEFSDFGSTLIVLWDSLQLDGKNAPSDPATYLEDYGAVGGPLQTIGARGWAAANSQDIIGFGYMVDGGEPVVSEEFKANTEDAVYAAATNAGCSYASRYQITVDVSALTGNHTIDFLIQFEDGTIVKMITNSFLPLSFEYSADGSLVNATPEPTEEPDPSSLDNAPGPILRLNDEEAYSSFFGMQRNQISDAYIDENKGCAVIEMDKVGDPWIVLMFTSVLVDDEPLEIDTSVYKVIQLGVRINAATGDRGQFYFQTDKNAGFDEAKDVLFDYKSTDELQYVNINMGKNKKWEGNMADSRIDPFSACSEPCEYELYYIAFFTNEAAANDFGEKWLADGDAAFPTEAPVPTKAPTAEPIATHEVVVTEVPATPEAAEPTEQAVATDAPVDKTPEKGDDNKDDNKDDKDNKKSSNNGLVYGIVGAVVAIAVIVAVVLIIAKKKKK